MGNELMGIDDGWTDILGEQLRGGGGGVVGANVMSPQQAYEILGEIIQRSPKLAQYAAARVANSRPIVAKTPFNKMRDFHVDFGPAFGLAGSSTVLIVNPQCHFRAEKLVATDSGSTSGQGSRITSIFVGNKSQRPANAGSTLTSFFAPTSLGNGVRWDTCEKGLTISMGVLFTQDCTFDATAFGRTLE
jgi:hypothetical protein